MRSFFNNLTGGKTTITVIAVALLLCLGALSGNPLPASAEVLGGLPGLQEQKVRVVYQLTDVIVRDADGNVVHGLGTEDFILKVDGKPVTIKTVDEILAPKPVGTVGRQYVRAEGEEEAELPPAGEAEQTEIAPEPRFIVIIFDRFNMGEQGMLEAKETAKQIVEEGLAAEDMVAVLQYNRSMSVLTGPTSDRKRILEAIDSSGGVSMNEHYRPDRLELFPPVNQFEANEVRMMLSEKTAELKNWTNSLRILAQALQRVPGRKVFLLFSEGPNVHNPVQMMDIAEMRANTETDQTAQFLSDQSSQRRQSSGQTGSQTGSQTQQSTTQSQFQRMDTARRSTTSAVESLTSYLTPQVVNDELQELSRFLNSVNTTVHTIRRGRVQSEWMIGADMDLDRTGHQGMGGAEQPDPMSGQAARTKQGESGDYRDTRLPAKSVTGELNMMENERLDVMRDTARMTNGKFFDAGFELVDLIAGLNSEMSDYYLLGFDPVDQRSGKYHKIEIEAKNPGYKLEYREGFSEPKKFAEMNNKERDIHLEEGFMLVGFLNELGMEAQSYFLPLSNNPTAVLSFRLDGSALETSPAGGRELEMVINLVDLKGRMRYRDHRLLKQPAGAELPERLWINSYVPLTPEPCAFYLALRDNASGLRATYRAFVAAATGEDRQAIIPPPVLLGPTAEGDLSTWETATVKDGVKLTDPIEPIGIRIPGRPLLDNTVAQGGFATLVVAVGNLGEGFDPSSADIGISFALLGDGEEAYKLTCEPKINYLASQNLLLITSSVPVGLSQTQTGELAISINGLPGEQARLITVPYRIEPFDAQEAAMLAHDSRIEKLQ
jgi:VWFA-related protein